MRQSSFAIALMAECALIGIPAGLMLAAWGRVLGSYSIRWFVMCVIGGSALGAALCLALALVPVDGVLLVLKVLPLGSAWALDSCMRLLAYGCTTRNALSDNEGVLAELDSESEAAFSESAQGRSFVHAKPAETQRDCHAHDAPVIAPSQAGARKAHRLSVRMIAGTALFGVAAGFMETFSSEPGMMSNPTLPVSLLFFVLFCGAAFQMTTLDTISKPEQCEGGVAVSQGLLDGVYRLALLVMMAGFLFVPVLGDFGVPGEAVVLAGYLGLSVVLTCLFLVTSQLTERDAALSFASGFTALFGGEMAGVVLGNVFDVLEPSGSLPYISVALAGLAALFAYAFLFTERDFRELSVIVQVADRFDDACCLIAQKGGLSKREAEVLPLALRGRTGERIAAELGVSKSTVDTHLRRIYTKCGVHSRQDLIDLGERTALRLSGGGQD